MSFFTNQRWAYLRTICPIGSAKSLVIISAGFGLPGAEIDVYCIKTVKA